MNCDTFLSLLSEYQRGVLLPERQLDAQAHLQHCEECRSLVAPFALAPDMAQDLTRSILARTTGSPCVRLRDLACAFVDGELGEPQIALVKGHLEHCPACRALMASLVELKAVLPALCEVEPGPRFTQEILRVTTHLPVPDPWLPSWAVLRERWMKLIRRPRICFEAAYLGTVAGVVVLNLPLPKLSVKAGVVEIVRDARPEGLLQPLVHSARHLVADVADFERRSADSLRGAVRRGGVGLSQELSREAEGLDALWHRVSGEVIAWFQGLGRSLPQGTKKRVEAGEPSASSARSSP